MTHYEYTLELHYEDGAVQTPVRLPETGAHAHETPQDYADWRLEQAVNQFRYDKPAPSRYVVKVYEGDARPGGEPAAVAEWP